MNRRPSATAAKVALWVLAACGVAAARPLRAQVDPSVRWETLHTAHFRIHFNPQLEDQARRAARNAERAYAALARELVPPRGTIDIVLADNVDLTNGQATPFPTNRIIIYAYPPVDAPTLRYYGDWNALIIQHELTHIFHLDRARGWWRIAQRVFGRNPVFMPNLYSPAWLTEGLAVYYESRLTGFGRLAGTSHRTLAEAAARDTALPRLDQLSLARAGVAKWRRSLRLRIAALLLPLSDPGTGDGARLHRVLERRDHPVPPGPDLAGRVRHLVRGCVARVA